MQQIATIEIGHRVLNKLADSIGASDFKFRPDFEMTFSANDLEPVWGFRTWGKTPTGERFPVRDKLVDEIVRQYRSFRPELGRFHINASGAYWGLEKLTKLRFVEFTEHEDPDDFVVTKSLAATNAEILKKKFNQ